MSNVVPFTPDDNAVPINANETLLAHQVTAREYDTIARRGNRDGVLVTVYPAGETWCTRFEDNSGLAPVIREGMTKETAVQMSAEAALIFGAEVRVQNTHWTGGME